MSNTQKIKEIKTKIEKLKKGLSGKTSASLKAKARQQISKYETEIKSLQGSGKKTSSGKSTSGAEKAKQISLKLRKNQGLSTSKSDIEKDAGRPALKSGKRTSKDGNTYYEYRENRIDRRPQKYARLADGGMMAKGGMTEKEKLTKELMKLQRELNSSRLRTYIEGDTSEKEMARQREREVKLKRFYEILKILRESEKMADGGAIQDIGGTKFSTEDLSGMFANGGELHRSQDGMYAKGGRISKDWQGKKTKEKFGKYDLYKMYENGLDLIADVVDYIKDLQKEIGTSYAKDFVYEMMDVLKDGKITYNDGSTLTFAKGGMLEHGLRIGDEVKIYRGNRVIVKNKHDETFYQVDLNTGERQMRDKGSFN